MDIKKLDTILYISRVFAINEQNFCTTYRQVIAIVYSLILYERIIIGFDRFNIVLNDHKPTLSCFTEEGSTSPIPYTAQMQSTKFQKICVVHTRSKKLSAADV